jgi:hypothetical protein
LPAGGGGAAGPDATTSVAKPTAVINFEIWFLVFDRELRELVIVFFTARGFTNDKLQIY